MAEQPTPLETENTQLRRMVESFRTHIRELNEEMIMVYNENNALKRQLMEPRS